MNGNYALPPRTESAPLQRLNVPHRGGGGGGNMNMNHNQNNNNNNNNAPPNSGLGGGNGPHPMNNNNNNNMPMGNMEYRSSPNIGMGGNNNNSGSGGGGRPGMGGRNNFFTRAAPSHSHMHAHPHSHGHPPPPHPHMLHPHPHSNTSSNSNLNNLPPPPLPPPPPPPPPHSHSHSHSSLPPPPPPPPMPPPPPPPPHSLPPPPPPPFTSSPNSKNANLKSSPSRHSSLSSPSSSPMPQPPQPLTAQRSSSPTTATTTISSSSSSFVTTNVVINNNNAATEKVVNKNDVKDTKDKDKDSAQREKKTDKDEIKREPTTSIGDKTINNSAEKDIKVKDANSHLPTEPSTVGESTDESKVTNGNTNSAESNSQEQENLLKQRHQQEELKESEETTKQDGEVKDESAAAASTEVENSPPPRSIELSTADSKTTHDNISKDTNKNKEDNNSVSKSESGAKEEKQKSTEVSTTSATSHSYIQHADSKSGLYSPDRQTNNSPCKSDIAKHDSNDELDEINKTGGNDSSSEPEEATTGEERSKEESAMQEAMDDFYPDDYVYPISEFLKFRKCSEPMAEAIDKYAKLCWKKMPELMAALPQSSLRDKLFKDTTICMPSKILTNRKLKNEVLGILGKVTEKNLEIMKKELTNLPIRQSSQQDIRDVINEFFKKSIRPTDKEFAPLYVKLLAHLIASIGEGEPAGKMIRSEIINQCKETLVNADTMAKELEEKSTTVSQDEADEQRQEFTDKQISNVCFLGLLFKNRLVMEKVILSVLDHLLFGDGKRRHVPPDYCIVPFIKLLQMCGPHMSKKFEENHYQRYRTAMEELSRTYSIARIRFLLMNFLETIDNNWQPVHGPEAHRRSNRKALETEENRHRQSQLPHNNNNNNNILDRMGGINNSSSVNNLHDMPYGNTSSPTSLGAANVMHTRHGRLGGLNNTNNNSYHPYPFNSGNVNNNNSQHASSSSHVGTFPSSASEPSFQSHSHHGSVSRGWSQHSPQSNIPYSPSSFVAHAAQSPMEETRSKLPDKEEFWRVMDDYFATNETDEIVKRLGSIPTQTLISYCSQLMGRYITTYKYNNERVRLGELFEAIVQQNILRVEQVREALLKHVQLAIDEDLFSDYPKYFAHWATVIKHGKKVFPLSLHSTLLEMLIEKNVSRSEIVRMIESVHDSLEDNGVGYFNTKVTTSSSNNSNNNNNNSNNNETGNNNGNSSAVNNNNNTTTLSSSTSVSSSSSPSPNTNGTTTSSSNNNGNNKSEVREYRSNDRFRVLQALLHYPQSLQNEEYNVDDEGILYDVQECDLEVKLFLQLCDTYDEDCYKSAMQSVMEDLKKSNLAAYSLISAYFTFVRFDVETLCTKSKELLKKLLSMRPPSSLFEEVYVQWKNLECPEVYFFAFIKKSMSLMSTTKAEHVERLKEKLKSEYHELELVANLDKYIKEGAKENNVKSTKQD